LPAEELVLLGKALDRVINDLEGKPCVLGIAGAS
jgi:hypothetical protein